MFEIGRARRVIGENPLKLRQGSGKASHLHALKIDQAVGFGNKPDKHGMKPCLECHGSNVLLLPAQRERMRHGLSLRLQYMQNRLNSRACHQLEDSLREVRMIHRRSAESEGPTHDASSRTTQRSMGSDQGFIAGPRRLGRRDGEGQSAVRGSRALSLSHRHSWRDLPERFGDFRVVHTRFSRWAKSGVWERIFKQLALDADNEYAMIDATIVRAHQHSAGAKKKSAKTQAKTRRSDAAKAD